MIKIKKEKIDVKGLSIEIYTEDFKNDYTSLKDIVKYKNTDDPRFVIQILTVCNSTRLEMNLI